MITPSEVVQRAFGTNNTLSENAIPLHSILLAQESFLLPALGKECYEAMVVEGSDTVAQTFAEEYLKQPLALYVASRVLPTIALQVGSVGVVRLSGESFEVADEATLRKAVARLRVDADRLLERATNHLASHPELYPSYEPQSTSHRIVGGVVM